MFTRSRAVSPSEHLRIPFLVGSLVVGGLILAAGLLAVQISRTIERSSHAVLAENVASLRAAAELELALFGQKGLTANYLLDADPRWLEQLEAQRGNADHWFARIRESSVTPLEREVLARIEQRYHEYDALRTRVVDVARAGRRQEALTVYTRDVTTAVGELRRACDEMLDINDRLIAESEDRSRDMLSWLERSVWGGLGVAILLGGIGGWAWSRSVTRRLVRSEKMAALGELSGSVAHEIRNPLTAIGLRLHTIRQESGLSESAREDLDVMQDEVVRLEGIVRSFLESARPPEPRFARVAVKDVVEHALAVLTPVLDRNGIRVETQVGAELPPVHADVQQIQQVLLNLVLNSIQAMPAGGSLRIAARLLSANGSPDRVEISVRDTGTGIPARLAGKALEPSASTRGDGGGLGLSIVRGIVDRHRGTVGFVPTDGPGATIVISLPVNGADRPAAP